MRLIRLYTEESLDADSSVFLKKKSYHYLSKVLRVKEKQSIVLFNNSGFNYHGYVKKVTNKDFDLKMTKVPSGLSNGGDIVMKIDRPNLNRFPSIEQSISNILLTSKKERRFDRLFGGSLYESLFDLSTDFNSTNKFSSARAINIRQSIIIALKNYEPRIRVLNVSLGEDRNQRNASIDKNELNVTIEYTIPPVEETITYTLGIKRVK